MTGLSLLSINRNTGRLPLDKAGEEGLHQGLRDEPFGKIRIGNISSFKIRYRYSSQVDPECSGWSNTIAAFFVFFTFLTFSSRFQFFDFF